MKQIIHGKTYGNVGFSPYFAILRGQSWSQGNIDADAVFRHTQPWSVAGVFHNFYAEILAPVENKDILYWTDTTFTLYVNGAPTALTVTVLAMGPIAQNGFMGFAQNTTAAVRVAPGDTLSILRSPADTLHGNTNAAYCNIDWTLTFESDNPGESSYGTGSAGPKLNPASSVNWCPPLSCTTASFAAAATPDPISQYDAHSIVPLFGSLYRVDVRCNTAPGANSFTMYAYKNGVKQDGSGTTVNTAMVVTGSATKFVFLFDLPLVPLNWLSIHPDPTTNVGTYNDHVTLAVGFRATTDGQSALCFSDSAPITDGSVDWTASEGSGCAWSTGNSPTPAPSWRPNRWPCTELLISYPGAIDRFTLSGFCVNRGSFPGVGKSYLLTTRKAFADTPSTVTMTGNTDPASRLQTDPLNAMVTYSGVGDRLNIQSVATGSPTSSGIGWAWVMSTLVAVITTIKSHMGSIYQGQQGATFTVLCTNTGDAPSFGTFTLTDTHTAGLTLVSMAGEGWTVVGNVATRSDSLAPGESYPPLYVTMNVAPDATSPQINQANEAVDTLIVAVVQPTPIVSEKRWMLCRFDANPHGGQQA